MLTNFLWNHPCEALKACNHSPKSSVSYRLLFCVCIYFADILCSKKEAFSLFHFRLDFLISDALVLSACHFFNAFGSYIFIPFTLTKLYISIFWPLGIVDQQGSERVSLIGQAQSSPIFVLLWLQRKGLLVHSGLCKMLFPVPHSAWWVPALTPALEEALWVLPQEEYTSSVLPAVFWGLLLHIPCIPAPVRFFCSHLLTVYCGAFFFKERTLANRREQEK